MQNPISAFIHKFKVDDTNYIYDVNTMHIIQVNAPLWQMVEDIGTISKPELLRKYAWCYTSDEIEAACTEASRAFEQGFLLSNRPEKIKLHYTKEYISEQLKTCRSQLTLSVTEDCNFRCTYCCYSDRQNDKDMSSRYMDWHTAKTAVDDFLSSCQELAAFGFYGGEPLLNFPLIKQVVEYAKKNGAGDQKFHFGLTTNGTLLNDEITEFLLEHNFAITISLDGPSHIHDRYRRFKGGLPSWEKIVNNLRRLCDKYPQLKTNIIMFNCVLVPPVDLMALDVFFSQFDFFKHAMSMSASVVNMFACFAGKITGSIVGLKQLYERFLDDLTTGRVNSDPFNAGFRLEKALFQMDFLLLHKRFRGRNLNSQFASEYCPLSICLPGVRRCFVTVDGNYFPCERLPESKYLKIGTTDTGISPDKIMTLMQEWVDYAGQDCRNCWCVSDCRVGCWANACEQGVPTRSLRAQLCRDHRTQRHNLLVDYCTVLTRNPHAFDYMEQIKLS